MNNENIALARILRHELHNIPEPSGKEIKTAQLIKAFLAEYTTLEIHDCGKGFYAAHREKDAKESIALRADYDSLVIEAAKSENDKPVCAHLCGHDGHTAGLCLAALELEGKTIGKNVFFLFQPAEETGEGAEGCCELFRLEHIDEIYGLHNLPGFRFGQVYTTLGSFAPASFGMTMRFHGKTSHAAYPKDGICPAYAVGRLLAALPEISAPGNFSGMVLCTVIGVQRGGTSFGEMCGDATVRLTLRGEHGDELDRLRDEIVSMATGLAGGIISALNVISATYSPRLRMDPDARKRCLNAVTARSLTSLCAGARTSGGTSESAAGRSSVSARALTVRLCTRRGMSIRTT